MRRSLIVEQQLAFPEGKATAEVLKVGQDPSSGVKYLGMAALAGAFVKFCATGLKLLPGTAQAGTYLGQSTVGYMGINLSPALISVGYIVGLNIAVLVFAGGVISWHITIPDFLNIFP